MYKLTALWPFCLLAACSSVSSADRTAAVPTALETQRDLVVLPGGGFVLNEAKDLLEFCIELNNQDDRNASSDSQYKAAPSGSWKIAYDSRNPENHAWNVSGSADINDPAKNGIKPFNNAWLLLKKEPDVYAIAIRGTVGEKTSIKNDIYTTTLPAYAGLAYPRGKNLPIAFAATPKAEVHLGFAYGAFSLLFNSERGILRQLRAAELPPNATLYITGHSQGAAIATLLHSFLHYAISDEGDRYKLGLKAKGIRLKSYLFAQPKPGNLQYALDFARIAGGMGFVINNDLDPVPMVPLSLEFPTTEVLQGVVQENQGKGSLLERATFDFLDLKAKFETGIKNHFAQQGVALVAKMYNDKGVAIDTSYFSPDENPKAEPATSLNYTLAGQLVPVFGVQGGGELYPPVDPSQPDPLLQHHATSYRRLVESQLTSRVPAATK